MIYTAIVADARKQTRTTSTNWTDANILIDLNNGLDEVASIIQQADGNWQWEDTNQTDLPIGTTDINSGQQDYEIDQTFLKVEKVWIHTTATDTTWHELTYIEDKSKFLDLVSTQDTGVPTSFTIIGNSILFDTFPNYASTNGLKVLFARNVKYFSGGETAVATTSAPGFNPQFHKYLSLYAQREWLEAYEKGNDHLNKVLIRMQKMEKDMQKYYSSKKKSTHFNLKSGININDYR